ncbi:MAG: crossover junction endodeoxyribonuclease RuvC, partial [bacterium]|nr:crossover junction endodeoxyribonuclease RuvC [bacterium]
MKQDRIILGIDPGVATVGFAVLRVGCDELELRDFGVITTSPDMEFPERLGLLQSDLRHLIGRHAPTEAYVEELFFGVNSKTALSVAHARGVILAELFSSGIQARSVTPNQVKLGVTGDGSADKRQL